MAAPTSISRGEIAADAADHVGEARHRARQVLSSEAHIGAVDDWRRVLVSARDLVILVWLVWVTLQGIGGPPASEFVLVALTIAAALLQAISLGRSTHAQVQYYAGELDRERDEIRNNYDHEREEVRALYAAKGFSEPLLTQIVDTLCADEDRLLKVMMEEELGLSLYHVNHPIMVGLWNFLAAAAAGLIVTLPVALFDRIPATVWIPTSGAVVLAVVAFISARATRRSMIEFFSAGVIMAIVTGGVAYALSQWFSGFMAR